MNPQKTQRNKNPQRLSKTQKKTCKNLRSVEKANFETVVFSPSAKTKTTKSKK
jgi:hypothetical protein